ncbi:MAG: hypothetical protein ACK5A0_14050, partial [Polaromonas sp.]
TTFTFNISFSPNPTACHYCPYTTTGADIKITGPPSTPKTYQPDAEDILNTITANADNNLQRHERGKLGRTHKPSTPNTPLIHKLLAGGPRGHYNYTHNYSNESTKMN